jgi:hypothetical protein
MRGFELDFYLRDLIELNIFDYSKVLLELSAHKRRDGNQPTPLSLEYPMGL